MADASVRTPLLGHISRQPIRDPLVRNLWSDVGLIAQIGVASLVIIVWVSVFLRPLILFSGHPLAQSLGVLALTQAILILQPTHEADQKRVGQRSHALLNLTSFVFFVTGVSIIEVNKFRSSGPHWHSVHGVLGIILSICLLLQYLVGVTMWAVPKLYGGTDNARAIWKYHRATGYIIYSGLLATIFSALWTDYNKNVLGIKWWYILVPVLAAFVSVNFRINLAKFGLSGNKVQTRQGEQAE
ncbi:hypothetical protein SODALDRAFT_323765 [Sodiomyces alkalinus F11]|uniref:Cytochrome b561 domain-containing protein n=1 Tax=Sodiomyces alkalinus (strain CBS 110278 / VKM F-3762 / F11) TaxID=1314773 RepID=A0A3N2PY12_SODAK|nr:hypothetical protein SODALDRAFT_323765 [Sodiomyces alkalinus F11]ROT39372.1 hypothetical protein SODALDRAFT_323765 [Sodiomyces alkalinus F11]